MKLFDSLKQQFSKINKRQLKENLTGYLFIAPSTLLVFLFGIFPVFFAFYMSLHKWRIKQGSFVGIRNYVKAIGDFAYLLFFAVGIIAFVGVYIFLKQILAEAKDRKEQPWLFIVPGLLFSGAFVGLLRWVVFLLPNFLGIAGKLIGQKRTRELIMQLLSDAFHVNEVYSAMWQFIAIFLIAIISVFITRTIVVAKGENLYIIKFFSAFTALVAGIAVFWFTIQGVSAAYLISLENNEPITLVPSLITIISGLFLLFIGFKVWQSASKKPEKKTFWVKLLAAFFLLVAGWILIGEIPQMIASGNKDVWKGLKVTVFFASFTIPFQLGISLFLSVLLFQKLRGSNILRIIYFLPYVTPAIASATVFKQLFSNRESSPVNMLLKFLGMQPQAWLHESKGVIELIVDSLGFEPENMIIGPSLALVVIIIHNIWTYVGYDTVIYMAGLSNISNDLLDAGEVDGASKWELFKFIIFPLLSPTTYFLSLMAIMGTFKAFNTIWMFRESLSLGTVDTFSIMVFTEFFEKLRYGYSTALAFILFAIILSLTYINNQTQGKKVFYG